MYKVLVSVCIALVLGLASVSSADILITIQQQMKRSL